VIAARISRGYEKSPCAFFHTSYDARPTVAKALFLADVEALAGIAEGVD
jgi:hypothetical protein